MVVCELDQEVSGEVMGWKLPAWQALLLHRVLPSCGGLVVYLTLMCFDFAIVVDHFQAGKPVLGSFCIILITWPALICLVFTLASAPPSLQLEEKAFSMTIEKKNLKWFGRQLAKCLFFPVVAIGRYCYLIFWWMEAVCASYVDDKERTREAILTARSSSPIELYLFLQSFLHAAPHTVVNILDIIARFSDYDYNRVSMQAISIVVSCMRMSTTATMYRRFEREKLNGRKYPWNKNSKALINNDNNNENVITDNNNETEPIYETINKPLQYSYSFRTQPSESQRTKPNSDLIQFSPRTTQQAYDDMLTDSDTSSDYFPPLSYKDYRSSSPKSNSDDEYVRPISIIDRVAPRRAVSTTYTIERVEIVPPPIIPAPRPGSIAVWAERMVENAESIPLWLSAPPRRKYIEVIRDEPDLPRRIPRSKMRGLEPQDATAALVHFLGWYAFFVSRLLSIAVLINTSIIASVIILFSHYQVMLLLLIVPQASTVRRGFYIFLAFVYLFCLMEFKVRFRHVRVWHVFWMIVCTLETVVFTGVWATIDRDIHDWWRDYIVTVILISMLLSYMCFLVYFVLLQPRETIVYINNKNKVMKDSDV